MKQDKNIGDLFKDKLASYEDSDINQDWDEMELKLNKLRFLRFSFTNFNIYYCSLVLATFALSSAIFIRTFFFQEENQKGINSSSLIDSFSNTRTESPSDATSGSGKTSDWKTNNNNQGNSPDGKNNEKATLNTEASPLTDNKEAANPEGANKAFNTPGKNNSLDNNKNNHTSSTNISRKEVTSGEKPNNKNLKPSGEMNDSDKNNQSSTNTRNDQITNKNSDNTGNSTDQKTGNVAHSTDQTTDKKQSGSLENNTIIDNLNIQVPKKNIVYITKQDTVEVFDTLRVKKPYKRK
jgi:hypothetical protein